MEFKDQGLEILEKIAEAIIESGSDELVEMFANELKKIIPGEWDDLAIEQAKPTLKPLVKEWLLKQTEKISPK